MDEKVVKMNTVWTSFRKFGNKEKNKMVTKRTFFGEGVVFHFF